MMNVLARIRMRLGDFWWYSLMLFVACRCGDVINAFVGLWLVPKYVPQEELGAVLPLLQVTSVIGLPISILVVTFTKFLNKYQTCGESGKVKSLLRSFWGFSLLTVFLGIVAAVFLLPHFFERIRVVPGSLGVLIVVTAALGTTSPVFTSAMQALKRFRSITVMNLLSAPIRLVVMLVAMPFRPLSGYMLGQAATSAFTIVLSAFSLRRELGEDVRAEPFLREDAGRLFRYTLYVALWLGCGVVLTSFNSMIFRQRLPEVESAAYYIITRLSEICQYGGMTMLAIMFPYVAEAHTKGHEDMGLFWRVTVATLGFGLVVALVLWVFGSRLMAMVPLWTPYVGYAKELSLAALLSVLGVLIGNFVQYEVACNRFGFLWHLLPVGVITSGVLACVGGVSYFQEWIPAVWIEKVQTSDLNHLDKYLAWLIICGVAQVCCIVMQLALRNRRWK